MNTQISLNWIKHTIVAFTVVSAGIIVSLPSEAREKLPEPVDFSALQNIEVIKVPVNQDGLRYRLNGPLLESEELVRRQFLTIQFDQKSLVPLAGAAKQKQSLKKRNDIALDRHRALLADFSLAID